MNASSTVTEPDRPLDDRLAARARAGDRQAFTELLHRHDRDMRRLAGWMLTDASAVDDVLQEAYLKAYRALHRYRDDARFGTWLHRITYNACIDEMRRSARRPRPVEHHESAGTASGPDSQVSTADAVRAALDRLPHEQRAAVVLVDGEGFDHRSAAARLGVAPGTVASRLSRARAVLRTVLEEMER